MHDLLHNPARVASAADGLQVSAPPPRHVRLCPVRWRYRSTNSAIVWLTVVVICCMSHRTAICLV